MTTYTYSSPKLEKMKPFCKNIDTICKATSGYCNALDNACFTSSYYYPTYLAKTGGDNTNLITFSQPDNFQKLFYNTNVKKEMIPKGNGGVYKYVLDKPPCMYTGWQNETCANEIIEPFDNDTNASADNDTTGSDEAIDDYNPLLYSDPCSKYENTPRYEKCIADNKHKGKYIPDPQNSKKRIWMPASTNVGKYLPALAQKTSKRCQNRQTQLEKNYRNPDKIKEILDNENCGTLAWWRDWLPDKNANEGPLKLNSTLKSKFNTQCLLNRARQRYGNAVDVPDESFQTTNAQIIDECETSIQDDMELHFRNLNYKHLLEQLPQYESGPERTYCN